MSAAFRLPVLRWTERLATALRGLGMRVLAAVPDGAETAMAASLTGGLVLVVGSEGRGVSPELLLAADGRVSLPMLGRTESLNAGVAGSILLYEAARQRAVMAGTQSQHVAAGAR